ncbi:MAG TPA: polyhydroxyalkanoic acid system family protein [Polyangiaceae bacterium]|jgi:hypothetical protein
MRHAVPHDLGKEKAKKATEAAFAAYTARFAEYNPQSKWVSDERADISFKVKGFTLKGSMMVLPKSIEMELNVPLLLRPFKKVALSVIEKEIRKWVDKAKRGEV